MRGVPCLRVERLENCYGQNDQLRTTHVQGGHLIPSGRLDVWQSQILVEEWRYDKGSASASGSCSRPALIQHKAGTLAAHPHMRCYERWRSAFRMQYWFYRSPY